MLGLPNSHKVPFDPRSRQGLHLLCTHSKEFYCRCKTENPLNIPDDPKNRLPWSGHDVNTGETLADIINGGIIPFRYVVLLPHFWSLYEQVLQKLGLPIKTTQHTWEALTDMTLMLANIETKATERKRIDKLAEAFAASNIVKPHKGARYRRSSVRLPRKSVRPLSKPVAEDTEQTLVILRHVYEQAKKHILAHDNTVKTDPQAAEKLQEQLRDLMIDSWVNKHWRGELKLN